MRRYQERGKCVLPAREEYEWSESEMSTNVVIFEARENGTYDAVIDGTRVATISPHEDNFIVEYEDSTHEIATLPALGKAQDAIRATFGIALVNTPRGTRVDATEKRERTPRTRTASRNGKPNGRTATRTPRGDTPSAEANPAPVKQEPREIDPEEHKRKFTSIRYRNTYERARGNIDVYVSKDELALVRKKSRALANAAHVYSDGSANIYPTPAQCANLVKWFPDTAIAAQCTLGGWKPWNASLKVAS